MTKPHRSKNFAFCTAIAAKVTLVAFLLTSLLAQAEPPARITAGETNLEKQIVKKTVTLAPGEHYAVKLEAKSGKLVFPPVKKPMPLPKDALRVLNQAPEWLRPSLGDNFRQLLLERIDLKSQSRVSTGDINGDGKKDLVVGNATGELRAFIAPYLQEDKKTFAHLKFQGSVNPALGDFDNDGKTDLFCANAGKLTVFFGPDFQKSQNLPFPDKTDWNGLAFAKTGRGNFFATKNATFKILGKEIKENSLTKFYMATGDLNADGKDDAVTLQDNGELAIEFDYFRTNAGKSDDDMIKLGKLVAKPKTISHPMADAGDELKKAESYPESLAIADVTGDGLPEIILGNNDGRVYFIRNRGTKTEPLYLIFNHDAKELFKMNPGLFSAPSFADINGDGKKDLVTGTQAGKLTVYLAPDWKEKKDALKISAGETLRPCFADINNDGNADLVVGNKSGEVLFFLGPDWKKDAALTIPAQQQKGKTLFFSSPSLGDFDNDGDCDMVVGRQNGLITWYENIGTKTKPRFKKDSIPTADKKILENLKKIRVNAAAAPVLADLNNDNKLDIIIGDSSGNLVTYLSPAYEMVNGFIGKFCVKSFASPAFADINGDGKIDALVGELSGNMTYLENVSDGKKLKWEERFAWRRFEGFKDQTQVTYMRYYREQEELLGANDHETLKGFASLIEQSPSPIKDEITYCVAAIPSEVLRTMHRMDQKSILTQNAQMVYRIASQIQYAKLVEKDNFTTIAYRDKDGKFHEAPRDIYYRWVVNPRILYEVPLLVDASWWDTPKEKYGMDMQTYLRHNPRKSIYEVTDKSHFWRTFLPTDVCGGRVAMDRLKTSKTVLDAVYALHDQLKSTGGAYIQFGYLTTDLQPLVIYKKHYGSCGEHSIITAAMARAALIPITTVVCYGEDHQWNEFWSQNKWYHWDLCATAPNAINRPWGSTESFGHSRFCSIVTRSLPNGSIQQVTNTVTNPNDICKYNKCGIGYTDTAKVTIQVEDAAGEPVDAALIRIGPRPRYKGLVSSWGYTNNKGQKIFYLGGKPYGYSFEAVSAFGSAGINSFQVEEGKEYFVRMVVPGKIPNRGQNTPKFGFSGLTWKVQPTAEVAYPPNYVSSMKRKAQSYLGKKTGYEGARFTPEPFDDLRGVDKYIMSPEKYALLAAGKPVSFVNKANDSKEDVYFVVANRNSVFTHCTAELTFIRTAPIEKPRIEVALSGEQKTEIASGQECLFEGKSSDNLGIKTFSVSFNGGETFIDVKPEIAESIINNDSWKFDLRQAIEGPLPPGDYSVCFKVSDYAGNSATTKTFALKVAPVRNFLNQIIRQDNPDSPLPKTSWMLGPFRVGEDERVLDIDVSTKSTCDIDIYLYYDKNGNGKIDGEHELATKSATPSGNEHINFVNVRPGTYWLYCQGWEVESGAERFDVRLSFSPKYGFIKNISPVGFANAKTQSLSADIDSPTGIKRKSLSVKLDGKDISEKAQYKNGKLIVPLAEYIKQGKNKKHAVSISVCDSGGNQDTFAWSFQIDDTAPSVGKIIKKFNSTAKGTQTVIIEASDDQALDNVFCQIDAGPKIKALPEKDKKGLYKAVIDFCKVKAGNHKISFVAVDKSGNEKKKTLSIKVTEMPFYFFGAIPADEGGDSVSRPVLQVFIHSQHKVDMKSLRVSLDGKPMKDGITKEPYLLRLIPEYNLKEGKHTVTFEGQDAKGNKDVKTISFTLQTDAFKKPEKKKK